MANLKDDIFKKSIDAQFAFNSEVAGVFDDMISRSIPGYASILELTSKALLGYVPNKGTITDIGCSTANILIKIAKEERKKEFRLIGIDDSGDMLSVASKKAKAYECEIEFLNQNVTTAKLPSSDAFVANFTLQFIRPIIREKVVENIFSSLNEHGVFLFAEKLISEDKKLNKFLIDSYHEYKKNMGYAKLEIMRKREALENVLVPYSEEENKEVCLKAGFYRVETLFKWCNFALFIALKR